MNQLDFTHADQDQHLNAFVNNLQNALGNNFDVNIGNGIVTPDLEIFPTINVSHHEFNNIHSDFFVDNDRTLENDNFAQNIMATGNVSQAHMNTILSFIRNNMLQTINNLHIHVPPAVLHQIQNINNQNAHAVHNHANANLNQNNINQNGLG